MKRRDFFKIMGAISGGILASCDVKKAPEKLLPYLVPPEDGIIPGEPVWYKSTCMECPVQCGTLVKNRENRAVKLEGLAGHPSNDGALCVRGQSSIERTYHPRRIRTPLLKKEAGGFKPTSWQESLQVVKEALQKSKDNKNVYISGRTTGTLNNLIDTFCSKYNIIRAPEFEMLNYATLKQSYEILFGMDDIPDMNLSKGDFLLTIGADIVETFVSPLEFARQTDAMKKSGHTWIHLEAGISLTGASASARWKINPGSEHYLVAYLLRKVAAKRELDSAIMAKVPSYEISKVEFETGMNKEQINQLVEMLNRVENPLVLAGGEALEAPNGLSTAIYSGLLQYKLNMINRSLDFTRTWNYKKVGSFDELKSFFEEFKDTNLGVLITSRIHEVGAVPGLKQIQNRSELKVAITDFYTDSLKEFDLILPLSSVLESWGDAESKTGVISIIQPAMDVLHNTKSEGDILLELMDEQITYQEYVLSARKNEAQELIENGVVVKEIPKKYVGMWAPRVIRKLENLEMKPFNSKELTLILKPSVRDYDGRSSVLSLTSEIPDPLSTVSYGKYISVSENLAADKHIENGDKIKLQVNGKELEVAAFVQKGLAGNVIQGYLDHILPALANEAVTFQRVASVSGLVKTGEKEMLPILSGSFVTDDRGILPEDKDYDDHGHDDDHGHKKGKHELYTLYKEHEHPEYRWSMSIDLDSCIGCSSCVAACYVENNIAITGKEEHLKGRELSWLRVEPYYDNPDKPRFVPMMCQHCDSAPCESVCPVFATYHNPEGLNAQVYNRCVGTRYCSNNCPYKARRFNWFEYERKEPFNLMLNPDVSDRPKGVMEKCTFCIQRIRYAKDHAKDEGRKVKDGEVIPACAQTCPTQAITFGNIKDTKSEVYQKAHSDGAYRILEELGTRPAVYYLNDVNKGNEHES
ncbi:MAG: TAT-variant-translocated molybdopterin oxidoreductase [Calditrichia bacterium]